MTASVTEYAVTGMTCGHCEGAVVAEVTRIPGVTRVDASAATGRVTVTAVAPVSADLIAAAVEEAGYQLGHVER